MFSDALFDLKCMNGNLSPCRIQVLTTSRKKPHENNVGKRENAGSIITLHVSLRDFGQRNRYCTTYILSHYQTILTFDEPKKEAIRKNCGKRK